MTDRRPTPCEDCGSREITTQTVTRDMLFTEEFNAQPFPMILCAACGGERVDLYPDATLTEDVISGWEIFDGAGWRLEIPFTHSTPPTDP